MTVRVVVYPSCFIPKFVMELSVPDSRDAEEYIDEYLDAVLSEDLRFNCEWESETARQ